MNLFRLLKPKVGMDRALLAQSALDWLSFLERERALEVSSLRTYRSSLRQLIRLLPEEYSTADLLDAFDERMGANATTHVRRSSYVIWNAFFDWWEHEDGPRNPLRNRKRPPAPDVHRRPFNSDEIQMLGFRLLAASPKDRAEVFLMIHQGFRESSVVELRVDDVDFGGGRIRVRGKHRLDTWLPMIPTVADALKSYMKFSGITVGYMFTGPRGKMSTKAVWKAWRRVAGDQLIHLKPHQCRNTFANALLRGAHADVHTVMTLMGHRSLKSTQPYLFEDMDVQRDAILRLPGVLNLSGSHE